MNYGCSFFEQIIFFDKLRLHLYRSWIFGDTSVQCCYIETDKELAYSFVEFTYNGDLLLQSIYDDDNDRSRIPARCGHEAYIYQTNLGEVVVKCQGGYCGYSNTPLIIVIKS
jgi:hypothetical protein